MAALHLPGLRAFDNHRVFHDMRIEQKSNHVNHNSEESSESISSFTSLPSRESSIDLKPSVKLYNLLSKKRSQVHLLKNQLKKT